MGFNCGIVGLPNVGKSTLFNALTKAAIEAANYPFCTIEPNVGVVPVPDKRLDDLAKIVTPEKVLSTTIEFVDIAGLVSGASKGEGLGNQFLGNIRETDAIAHVVRCFDDKNIVHVSGNIDPVSDIETIETELILADMASLDRLITRLKKQIKSGDKLIKAQLEAAEEVLRYLEKGELAKKIIKEKNFDSSIIKSMNLLTTKPVMYIANVSDDGFSNNPYLDAVIDYAKKDNSVVVPVCASIESELAQLDDEDKEEFLSEYGLDEPGLNRVIRSGYELLSLGTYFTAGVKEVRAWTVNKGSTAPKAAGVIHTDFEKGFIRAEVIAFEDFISCNGEQGAKDAGKWRLEGKDYILSEGDVIHFRFNV